MNLKQVIHYAPTNSVEATWVDDEGKQVRCHSYDQVQMDMLESDLGADAAAHAELISTVRNNQLLTPPAPPEPPVIVTPRQIRQALTRFNLRAQVEAAVAAGDQDLKDWWEFATQFEENHPKVVGMAQSLGVSDTDLHALFVAAKAL